MRDAKHMSYFMGNNLFIYIESVSLGIQLPSPPLLNTHYIFLAKVDKKLVFLSNQFVGGGGIFYLTASGE